MGMMQLVTCPSARLTCCHGSRSVGLAAQVWDLHRGLLLANGCSPVQWGVQGKHAWLEVAGEGEEVLVGS